MTISTIILLSIIIFLLGAIAGVFITALALSHSKLFNWRGKHYELKEIKGGK